MDCCFGLGQTLSCCNAGCGGLEFPVITAKNVVVC